MLLCVTTAGFQGLGIVQLLQAWLPVLGVVLRMNEWSEEVAQISFCAHHLLIGWQGP